MANQIALNRYVIDIANYIDLMNQDNESLEYFINLLLASITGQTITGLDVPRGLQQIFDRRGVIGTGSFDFNNGSASPIAVAAGAYWSGSQFYLKTASVNLSMAGFAASIYYLNLDASGNPLVSASADATTTRQFSWDGAHVSAKALYAGVAILFDGDDYAACLTSIARGLTFTRLADRLEAIETLLPNIAVQTIPGADTININWALGGHVRVSLNRPTTTINMSGGVDGQRYVLELNQDAVGGRTVVNGAALVASNDLPFPLPVSAGANKSDEFGWVYHGPTGKYRYSGIVRGF